MVLHDIHTHFFNVDDIPLQTFFRRFGILISIIIRDFKTLSKDNKVRKFLDCSERTRSDVAREYVEGLFLMAEKNKLPVEKYVVCPLVMDFESESRLKKVEYQIKKLEEALNKRLWTNVEFRPFVGVRYENKNNVDFIEKHIKKGLFHGIKIYPPLDFDVKEACNCRVFQCAQDNSVPVTAHCSGGGFPSMNISRFKANRITNPKNWRYVLDENPYLKLNLAHMGGLKRSWTKEVVEICRKYPNAYTDISYVICKDKKLKRKYDKFKEKNIDNKVLFGTDWYMTSMESKNLDKLCSPFLERLSKKDIVKIMETNPMRFLGK